MTTKQNKYSLFIFLSSLYPVFGSHLLLKLRMNLLFDIVHTKHSYSPLLCCRNFIQTREKARDQSSGNHFDSLSLFSLIAPFSSAGCLASKWKRSPEFPAVSYVSQEEFPILGVVCFLSRNSGKWPERRKSCIFLLCTNSKCFFLISNNTASKDATNWDITMPLSAKYANYMHCKDKNVICLGYH